MSKEQTSVLLQWISSIEDTGRGLTQWEENFVESVKYQLRMGGSLSEKQVAKLESIYAEKTP